jgi:hypothetical protein
MKAHFFKMLGALLASITLLSCNKETLNNNSESDQLAAGEKAETWFRINVINTSSATINFLGAVKPEWNKTKIFDEADLYITPITTEAKTKAAKYFVAKTDGNSNITAGSYFVVLKKEGITPVEAEKLIKNQIAPDKYYSNQFSGAVLEYNLNNTLVNLKHYESGIETKQYDNILGKNKNDNNRESFNREMMNANPCEDGAAELCIDWFWQTFVNGVLFSEEYLYTSCQCMNNSGGGGAGSPSDYDLCVAGVNQVLNNTNSSSVLLSTDMISLGTLARTKMYSWKCVEGAGWYVVAYDRGVHQRVSVNKPWIWSSLENLSISKNGNTIGLAASVVVSKLFANATLGTYNSIMHIGVNVKATLVKGLFSYTQEKDLNSTKEYNLDTEAMPGY